MRLRLLVAALIALVIPAAASAQSNGIEATIRGRVIDEETGQPVADVLVELLDHVERIRGRAITDAQGAFVLTRVAPGPFWLRGSHIAYRRTKTPPWRVEGGEVLDVTLRLHSEVALLAPLEVTARARAWSPSLANFYDRLNRRTFGTLLSRDDIERRNPQRVTDLLMDIPGLQFQGDGAMNQRVVVNARATPGIGGSGCPVQIYVDGVRATRGRMEVSPDEILSPAWLEGVEFYGGISTVPPEFLTPEARCGVIAFWTRRGG